MVNFTAASSNCSDDVRISGQHQSITPSQRVCKNLFGTDNRDEFREEMRQQNIERLQEKKIQYNFDFEKEEPLPGRYLWERVSNLNRTKNCKKLPTEEIPKNSGSHVLSKNNSLKKTSSKDQGEHKITDYFRSKKRKYDETIEKDHPGNNEVKKIRNTTTHRDLDKSCTEIRQKIQLESHRARLGSVLAQKQIPKL